ncbi:phage protein [Oceanobacter sp. 4_MG-2023]|uniref:phage protein n=1 Tax=Oceanobacter sp. 4_MG-2023 TaxID=3062623 RepID=UPI00273461D4|nr:phage protein [Oceanobacter sp. 4_MG-2023]MDP2548896.1 DUF2597 family protein [Oceanobacter sp. 4_MG-2023]
MGNRINGKSFDVRIMGIMVHVESMTLTITDNTTTATNNGRPAGTLQGDVSASGDLVLDISQFNLLTAAAAAAGSWQDLPEFPVHTYAVGGSTIAENMLVYADGCKLKISDLLNIDPNSTDKSTVTVQYDVTGEDFVKINGVPYISGDSFGII